MKINADKIEKTLIRLFLVVAIIMFAYLFVFSFIFSYENIFFNYQEVFRVNDNIFANVIGGFLLLCAVVALSKGITKIKDINYDLIALGMGVLSSCIAIVWIFSCGSVPGADAGRVSVIASQVNNGDYSSFEPGEYMGMFHQQLGIVSVLRVLYWIFGDMNYNSFRVVASLSIILLIYSGYKLTKIISKDNKNAEVMYCVLVFLCLPIYFFAPHVYGELISASFTLLAMWMFLELLNKFSAVYLALLAIALFVSYMFRQNTLVAAIAMIAILFIKLIIEKRKSTLILIAVILIACRCQTLVMSTIYESHYSPDAKQIPPSTFVAMGLNEDNNMAGWWNREPFVIYQESDYNPEIADKKAKILISNRMNYYLSNPKQYVHFLIKKVSSQWLAPMCQSIASSNVIDGSESKLANAIYYNKTISNTLTRLMDFYQILVYGLALLWLLIRFKEPGKLEDYLIPISAFGGMLLSIIWEAKTRYIFPYYLMIIVLAAVGMSHLVNTKSNCNN